MERVTIKLATPVELPTGFLHEISFRPATFLEFCQNGSPFSRVPVDGDIIDHADRVKLFDWAKLLAAPEHRGHIDGLMNPADWAAVEAALRGFFVPASTSTPVPTISSSALAGGRLTSIA